MSFDVCDFDFVDYYFCMNYLNDCYVFVAQHRWLQRCHRHSDLLTCYEIKQTNGKQYNFLVQIPFKFLLTKYTHSFDFSTYFRDSDMVVSILLRKSLIHLRFSSSGLIATTESSDLLCLVLLP